MENKAHAIAAGAFVLGLIAVLVGLVVWFTRDNTVRNIYELSTRDPVSGLQPQAMVRYRGIAVGKVTSIDFDPKTRGNVRVRITVDQRVPLTTSSFATLSYQGVTGLAFIALDDKGESNVALAPNNDDPPRIPLKPSMLAQLQDRGEAIINQVDEATKRANQLLGDDNQKRAADALENIAAASASANTLLKQLDSTVKTGLNPALAALPGTLSSVKTAAGDVSRVANNFNTTVGRLNAPDGPIERLSDGTKALAQSVDSFNAATLPRGRQHQRQPAVAVVRQRRHRRGARRARLLRAARHPFAGTSLNVMMTMKNAIHLHPRRAACAGLALLLLAGCGALPDKPARATLYDFGPGPAASAAAANPPAAALPTLALAEIESNTRLDGTQILYRLGYADANELRPYGQSRWSLPPAQLLRQRLRDALAERRTVLGPEEAATIARAEGKVPDTLRISLDEFSHYFDSASSSVGLVRMRATLIRGPDRKSVV